MVAPAFIPSAQEAEAGGSAKEVPGPRRHRGLLSAPADVFHPAKGWQLCSLPQWTAPLKILGRVYLFPCLPPWGLRQPKLLTYFKRPR